MYQKLLKSVRRAKKVVFDVPFFSNARMFLTYVVVDEMTVVAHDSRHPSQQRCVRKVPVATGPTFSTLLKNRKWHCKKLATVPSPAGMTLTKLSKLFPPRESLVNK
jgi:hypothetical protein